MRFLLLAAASIAFALTPAQADDRTCGKGVVGFRFADDSPNLAVLVNGVKLYEVSPSGLAEVDERSTEVPSRGTASLTGTGGSWGAIQCSYHSTWVAAVQWTTTIEVAGAPVNVKWKTVVSVDPSAPSPDDPRTLSNAVEWMLEIEGWPRVANDTHTIAFGVLLRPVSNSAAAANGGPDFMILPPIARYDGAVGDVATAFCSSRDYQAAPWPPCPNRFSAFEVCERCTVAELSFTPFEHNLQYPAPLSF